MNNITSFTSQPKASFYDELFFFLNLDTFSLIVATKKAAGVLPPNASLRCHRHEMRGECMSQIKWITSTTYSSPNTAALTSAILRLVIMPLIDSQPSAETPHENAGAKPFRAWHHRHFHYRNWFHAHCDKHGTEQSKILPKWQIPQESPTQRWSWLQTGHPYCIQPAQWKAVRIP